MCGGTMKKVSKFNVGIALGSLTAAVALLTGVPIAGAYADDTSASGQAAPGGGAFPGSFLVPGTNTSIKIGGFAKGVYIYDMSATPGAGEDADVVAVGAIPLEGTAAHQMHGATRLHARQSSFNIQTATPTSWGELDTFILVDFFGQNTAQASANANTQNARMVFAYGTLGPLLAGQFLSLFFDGDALGEVVDPTAQVGLMNGLTNRAPQFRYTYIGANGLSLAASVEEPVWELTTNDVVLGAPAFLGFTAASGGGGAQWNKYPDFIFRGRWDQAWGHIGLAGAVRDQDARGIGLVRQSHTGWGLYLSAHWNVFGKDTLRGGAIYGEGLGHYLSDMGTLGGVQQTSALVQGVGFRSTTPTEYGASISYTHWWTNELRSTGIGGYSRLLNQGSIITSNIVGNALDKAHVGATINLIWSPVPQVDLGIEYDWAKRSTQAPNIALGGGGGNSNHGYMNRVEGMAVFKF